MNDFFGYVSISVSIVHSHHDFLLYTSNRRSGIVMEISACEEGRKEGGSKGARTMTRSCQLTSGHGFLLPSCDQPAYYPSTMISKPQWLLICNTRGHTNQEIWMSLYRLPPLHGLRTVFKKSKRSLVAVVLSTEQRI